MDKDNEGKISIRNSRFAFFRSRRFLFILLGMFLFLPPLSILPQLTGDNNFCGTWCPRMFFLWRKGMTGSEFLMGFVRSYLGVTLVVSVLVSTFFWGRFWCSHLCPIGGATEVGSKIVPGFLKIDFSKVPSAPIRYGYLSVYLLAPVTGIGHLCCNYCNFVVIPRLFGAAFSQGDVAYFLRTAGLINLGLIVVFGFIARGGRAYCNFLCPLGALDAISNRLGIRFGKRVRVNASRCDACGACARVCPTWAIEMTDRVTIDHFSCISCRECEKVCGGAINYGKA